MEELQTGPLCFIKRGSKKWKQGNCPSAVAFRSVNAQLSSLPFCPGGPLGNSQVSLDKLLGHSCPGGCMGSPCHAAYSCEQDKLRSWDNDLSTGCVHNALNKSSNPPSFQEVGVSGRGWVGTTSTVCM